jgi:hypothetical protein
MNTTGNDYLDTVRRQTRGRTEYRGTNRIRNSHQNEWT